MHLLWTCTNVYSVVWLIMHSCVGMCDAYSVHVLLELMLNRFSTRVIKCSFASLHAEMSLNVLKPKVVCVRGIHFHAGYGSMRYADWEYALRASVTF